MGAGLRVTAMLIKYFQLFCSSHAILYPGTVYLQQTRKFYTYAQHKMWPISWLRWGYIERIKW